MITKKINVYYGITFKMNLCRYIPLPKIVWRLPVKSELVIYDQVGSNELNEILQLENQYTVLPVRRELIYLNPKLVFKAIYFLALYRFGLRLSYDLAFVSIVKPKLLITLIDNNYNFHRLSKYYKASFMCIQNGFRSHNCASSFKEFPTLFCFGQRDIDLYKQNNVVLNRTFPIGSIRSSYFFNKIVPLMEKRDLFDICYISEYLPGMERNNYHVPFESLQLLYEWTFTTLKYLNDYSKAFQLKVVVAGRQKANDNQGEIEFYKKHLGENVEVIPSDKSYLNSYRLCFSSRVVLCYCSTLGFEALSWGKKVLFFPHPKEKNLIVDHAESLFFKTQQGTYQEFKSKLDILFAVPIEEYCQMTSADKEYFISSHLDTFKIIKTEIDYVLKKTRKVE